MATPNSPVGNVVFIDTNLDTHLVLTVSDHDTVSDLKQRIVSEHTSCFPKVGQIQIHGIKVKRRGYFYHLSDSMIVRTAFIGFNKNWFLSVDVSALGECKQNDHLFSHASIDIANNDLLGSRDNAIVLPSNHQLQLLENKQDEREEIPVVRAECTDKDAVTNLEAGVKSSGNRSHLNHEVPSLHMECDVDGIGKGNKDFLNACEEELSVSVQSGKKKKRKSKRKREYDTVGDDISKEEIPSVQPCVSELTEKNAVKNLEMVPSLPSARKKHKSKRVKDDIMGGDNSKDNIAYVNNPVGCPFERASSFNNFQEPENKDDEKEEIPIDCPCVSEHTEKAVKKLEMVQTSYIECDVDGSNKGIKDGHIVCEEGTSELTPKAKKKKLKSTRKKEDTVGGNYSKDNIASVDNPLGCPSEKASSFNNLPGPQSENKPDEKEEIPFDRPCVPDHTGKEAVLNMEMVPNSRIECEEGTSEPTPKAKKKKLKSTGKNEDTVRGSNSKDNIAFVDSPSEKASSFNNFQGPQSENKPDKKEDIPFDHPCVPEHTEREAVKNLEMVPNLRFECVADGSNEGIKDDRVVSEEGTSGPAPRTKKKKHKNKRKKEDTVGDNNSKDNIASVDNPLSCPSERASSFNNFQVSRSENKLDEKEVPFDWPRLPEHTEKEAVKKLEMIPNLHIECVADGSNEVIKDDHIVCEEGTSEPAAAKKKKHKSKRKKKDTVGGDNSKENDASVVVPDQQDIAVPIIYSENADKEVIKGTEVLEEHWHTKNDEKALSMKEASELSPAVKKEHKKRKRSLAHDSREPLNVATESQKDQAQMSDRAHGERKESNDESELNNYKSGDDVVHKNNKTEDILDTRSPAKKRKKGKERSKEKSLSDKKLVNDFDVDNSSHHLLEGQHNIKNRKADQSTEHFNDGDQDEKADHFSTQREGVQEEIPVDRLLSKDIITNKMTPDKMEIGTDACKESIQSTTKETGNHKNQSDIEMEIQPSDVNEPKDLMEDNENVVLRHCHESEVGQIEGAEEGVEASPQNDSKLLPSERCTRSESNQDKTNANIRELKATSNVVDANGMNEPLKPGKEKKGIKIVNNKGGGQTLQDDKGLVDASESETFIAKSLKATVCDPMPGNAETPRRPLNQTEGKVMQQEEMQGTVLSGADMDGHFSMDNSDSLEQAKTKSNAENVGKRLKNKSNSKQTSSSKDTSDMVTNGHAFDSKKECDVHRIDKSSNALKTGKLSSQSESAMSSIDENRKSRDNASGRMDVEKQRDHTPISNSKLEGSNQIVQNSKSRKTFRNHVIGINNTQQKKSLLEGAIFKDDSSSASEDEDQVDNSDASTRTPSINSLASDFLDGYDSPGLDSQQNGFHDGKSLENGEGSSLKASLSDVKGMPIDRFIRSSSRYKKAKIIASQLDESESQPDFVPDSFADM